MQVLLIKDDKIWFLDLEDKLINELSDDHIK